MTPDDRLERLERRLHDLEELVLDLQAAIKASEVITGPRTITKPATPRVVLPPAPPTVEPQRASGPAAQAQALTTESSTPGLAVGTEQWFGQRGLLAAGVFLLILAAGYFLKLAFDRGWISPLLRSAGGGVFGLAVAAVGWRVHERGLRTYGAALIGCGAAIVYLAAWAAVRLYGLLPVTVGLGTLALLSVATFGIARVVNVEALAAAAVLGAFLAPLVIGRTADPNVLLLYSFFLAAGLGAVAQKRWRLTTFLIALSFFVLGFSAGLNPAVLPGNVLMYAVLGAGTGLLIGLRERWTETRFLAFWGGWLLLWVAALQHPGPGLLVAVGGLVLTAAIWWHGWSGPTVWPDELEGPTGRPETLYFYVTPLWLAWAIALAAPAWFARHDWAAPLAVALPYLAAGFARPRIPFAVVGTTAAMVAVLAAWPGVGAVQALLALALLWAGLDHLLSRTDGRWYALVAVFAALIQLVAVDASSRGVSAPAFLDAWAITLWLATAAVAALAAGLWRRVAWVKPVTAPRPIWQGRDLNDFLTPEHVPAVLWVLVGTLLFAGVSGELTRFFHQTVMSRATARLAGGLAVSAWWAVFAAGLVVLGFVRQLKPVRIAGLAVSGLAVAKVLLFDLSELDALYRVASVFILGLVSLGVAYLYHRHARGVSRPVE